MADYQTLYNPRTRETRAIDLSLPDAQRIIAELSQQGWQSGSLSGAYQEETPVTLQSPATQGEVVPVSLRYQPNITPRDRYKIVEQESDIDKFRKGEKSWDDLSAEDREQLIQIEYKKIHVEPERPQGIISKIKDVALETVSLGQVQTRLFNEDDIAREYDKGKTELAVIYDQAASDASKKNEGLAISKDEFIKQSIGGKREYIDMALSSRPSLGSLALGAAVEMVPFSQFFIPGRLESYKDEGAKGYTKLAISTLFDLSLVTSVAGSLSKGLQTGIKRTAGGTVASLGGRRSVETLIKEAEKKLIDVSKEVVTRRIAVKDAEAKLAQSLARRSVDTELRRDALALARKELKESITEHPQRLKTAQANIDELKGLIKAADRSPQRSAMEMKAYKATGKGAEVAAAVAPPMLKAYGLAELGMTAYDWENLSGFQKAMGIGMATWALGIPGSVIGRMKSGAEVAFSPGRIPHRAIAVPEKYIPGKAGMPKTTVKGLSAAEQMEAMNISADAMKMLWEGKGKVHLLWPTKKGKKLVYAPRSEFQKVIPKSSISATPTGNVFDRPIYAVITVREPAQYLSVWGFPKFTEASAAGIKGGQRAYLVVFSEQISRFPRKIRNAPTPQAMRKQAERIYGSGRMKPGEYPGYKLFKGTKEPELTIPAGTEVGRIEGGVKFWTRAEPFGPRIELQPHFILAEEGARRTGFTMAEAFALKKQGLPAEIMHYIEAAQFWKRGIAGETRTFARMESRIKALFRSEERERERLSSLMERKASRRRIAAVEKRVEDIYLKRMEAETRLYFRKVLRDIDTDKALRALIFRSSGTGGIRAIKNIIERAERDSARLVNRYPELSRTPDDARADRTGRAPASREPERAERAEAPARGREEARAEREAEPGREPERPGRQARPGREARPPETTRTPRQPEAETTPIKRKKDSDIEIGIERVSNIPDNPGTVILPQGVVDWHIMPPYRRGEVDIKAVHKRSPTRGEGSPQAGVRTVDGDAPDRLTLRLSRKSAVDIFGGRRLRYYRPMKGPGIIRDGKMIRQRPGTLLT